MNLTIDEDYARGASRIGHGPRRKECAFWKMLVPNVLSASGLHFFYIRLQNIFAHFCSGSRRVICSLEAANRSVGEQHNRLAVSIRAL